MVGTLARSNIMEIRKNYAVGIDLYSHGDEELRAPYFNLYKSRRTHTALTCDLSPKQTRTGMTQTLAVIYLSTELTPGGNIHGIAQFGGVDPNNNPVAGNIIFYRPLTWGNNSNSRPGLFPGGASSPPVLHVRAADDSVDANLTAGALLETIAHTPSSSSDTERLGESLGTQAMGTRASPRTHGSEQQFHRGNVPNRYCSYTIATIYSSNAARYFDSEGRKRLLTYEGSPEKGTGSKRE
jgi:hypothetical protein